MKYPDRIGRVAISALLVIFALAAPTRGGLITSLTAQTTPEPGGLTKYDYTLENDPLSDLRAYEHDLVVATDANIQSITRPTGWDIIYSPGDSLLSWVSPDASTDLQPGFTAEFSLVSDRGP